MLSPRWQKVGAAMGVAGLPYVALKWLQLDTETREAVERISPELVDWVRYNYGFEDEDRQRRAHVAATEALRASAPQPFIVYDQDTGRVVHSGALEASTTREQLAQTIREALPQGSQGEDVDLDLCVRFRDIDWNGSHSDYLTLAKTEGESDEYQRGKSIIAARRDVSADSMMGNTGERSLWDTAGGRQFLQEASSASLASPAVSPNALEKKSGRGDWLLGSGGNKDEATLLPEYRLDTDEVVRSAVRVHIKKCEPCSPFHPHRAQ